MSQEDDSELFAAALATRATRPPPAMSAEVSESGDTVYRMPGVIKNPSSSSSAAGAAGGDRALMRKTPRLGSVEAPVIAEERLVTRQDLTNLCEWIPLRLAMEERKLLLLLEGALQISEYTDNVDVARNNFGYGQGRGYGGQDAMVHEMREFAQLVVGLYVASDLKRASEDVEERRDPFEFHELLRSVFEVGRRYKIQNPTKMRTTYGKMMHILMDAVQPAMTNEIGANMFTPTQSVHSILRPFGAAGDAFLADPDLLLAASPIDHARGIDDCVGAATMSSPSAKGKGGKSNVELAARELHMRKAKQAALQRIKDRHVRKAREDTSGIPAVVVERCLESIGDALAFISVSTASVEAMIDLLLHFFDPRNDGGGAGNQSLQLRYGSGGEMDGPTHSRLSRSCLTCFFIFALLTAIHGAILRHCLALHCKRI
eukprot:INCI15482.1.p1 GENE.INCI15482.1~~INCI15482.1.p1  ORF type:complete len:430 (-),score=77.61 INCI15482.1:1559-2848(-)